ncbi:FtsK/SpoIIIE domain-containing protein [Falsihalocynthiibacter sp. CO-5D18]|uniref:FtsK/SpoIIIE domain-containing protein n=1 Tax=Falsihalocynthiibacter sp. CO-5D18 TaxID=3240872 RepID=UPI00350EA88D
MTSLTKNIEDLRADLVGRVVWGLIRAEAPNVGRSIFLLTGLDARHLAGISRECSDFPGQSLKLAISPHISNELLSILPSNHLSDDPPVLFRNSDAADIVVLAVPDSERDAVGSSLGDVSRIDRVRLQSETDHWLEEIKGGISGEQLPPGKIEWLKAMIRGLDISGVTKELDQFAEFIQKFIDLPDGWLFTERLRQLGPVLNLPRGTFDSIPSEASGKFVTPEDFRRMFRDADARYSGIPFLRTSDDKRFDGEQIAARIEEFRKNYNQGQAKPDDPKPAILDLVEELVQTQSRLRRGDWLTCQSKLCEQLDWSKHGEKLFDVKTQKKTRNLPEKTREHFEREFPENVPIVNGFLTDFADQQKTQSDDEKEAFFEKYESEIRSDKRLYEEWRRHLFASTVKDEPDLLSAILEGAKTVLVKNMDSVQQIDNALRFYVTVKGCEKASTWESLDKRTFSLFRHEAQLLSGALSGQVDFNFGKWLDPQSIAAAEAQSRKEARVVELEMGIIEVGSSEGSAFQKVRIFWRPSDSGKDSIALAWPEDIEALVHGAINGKICLSKEFLTPKGTNASRHLPISLKETGSFSDVCGGEDGRTADPANTSSDEDIFKKMFDQLEDFTDRNVITQTSKDELVEILHRFRDAFSAAIAAIHSRPETAYQEDLISEQASLFGELCSKARTLLTDATDTRVTLLREICEFGIVVSETSQNVAIIPAWHPLRLLERMTKAKEVSTFIETFCADRRVTVDGLERACRKYTEMLAAWCFPEIVSVNFKIHAAVEHTGGYSLTVPVDAKAGSLEALESSSRLASQHFMRVADEYLSLNPHEEDNFSTAIYNSETVGLPSQIAESLERKMAGRENLRCSLLITHDKPAKMREAYAQQTALLQGKNLGSAAAGFLSRLRVGVRRGTSSARTNRRPDIDIAYLHEAFFRHSEVAWDFVQGGSDDLPSSIDLSNNLLPRRKGGEEAGKAGAGVVQLALSPMKLPRSIAQFVDLCFAANRDVRAMKTGHRAIPMRGISWDSDAVKSAIKNAHDLAEWVVSFDHLSSRDMLAGNDIKIIRDILVPGTEARLIVSSREPNRNLLRHITDDFERMNVLTLSSDAKRMANRAVSTVVQVAGQKIMGAARSETTAREIIGLAAATGVIRALQEKHKTPSVWFSLDDNKATFGLREKIADTLSVSVRKDIEGTFIVDLTVVEAKCVAKGSEAPEAKSSRQQTLSTMRVLRDNFVDQEDPIAKRAWGADFLSLLALRPEFSRLLSSREDLSSFQDSLVAGHVDFTVQGRSVIVLHDDQTADQAISGTVASEDNMLVQHRLGQRALGAIMMYLEDTSVIDALDIQDPIDVAAHHKLATPSIVDNEPPITSIRGQSATIELGKQVLGTDDKAPDTVEVIEDPHVAAETYTSNSTISEVLWQALSKIAEEAGSSASSASDIEMVEKNAQKLQAALLGYGMQAEFAEEPFTSTPNGIIVRFKGHDTLTVKKVSARRDELKSTHALDVISANSGLGEVSFYIARFDRQTVNLADVWLQTAWPDASTEQLTSFLIGTREDTGAPLWLNLTDEFGGNTQHGPHTLIAGETGSGKGVLIQNLLLQLVAFNSPKNLKLYVIDPKFGADFFWISEAPHLVGGIASSQEESERVLGSLVDEMERRYALISAARTPNIAEYNRKVSAQERLPRIVIFHDEMADWMADSDDYRKMIQDKMTRIASKARACGMNVFLITQRASQDAIPVGIRDNLNNRLCLKVASKAGSELALKLPGGELLLGRGQLAANLSGDRPSGGDYFTAQVPFASTQQLELLGRAAISAWQT